MASPASVAAPSAASPAAPLPVPSAGDSEVVADALASAPPTPPLLTSTSSSQSLTPLTPDGVRYRLLHPMPLHEAAANKEIGRIWELVSAGVNVNACDTDGCTPLHIAVRHKQITAVDALLACKADVNMPTAPPTMRHAKARSLVVPGQTPLHFAVDNGSLSVVRMLLEHGANALAQDRDKCTPLHVAARAENVDIVDALVSAASRQMEAAVSAGGSASPGRPDAPRAGAHAGSSAAAPRDVVQYINQANASGYTPLHLACQHSSQAMVHKLMTLGADPRRTTAKGLSAVDVARSASRSVALQRLLVRAPDAARPTASALASRNPANLLQAAANGDATTLRALLTAGVQCTTTDAGGNNALHKAVAAGNLACVQLLLTHGCSSISADSIHVDARNRAGWTCLHLAAKHGSIPIIQALLRAGADARSRLTLDRDAVRSIQASHCSPALGLGGADRTAAMVSLLQILPPLSIGSSVTPAELAGLYGHLAAYNFMADPVAAASDTRMVRSGSGVGAAPSPVPLPDAAPTKAGAVRAAGVQTRFVSDECDADALLASPVSRLTLSKMLSAPQTPNAPSPAGVPFAAPPHGAPAHASSASTRGSHGGRMPTSGWVLSNALPAELSAGSSGTLPPARGRDDDGGEVYQWLDSLGLAQYAAPLLSAGYDNMHLMLHELHGEDLDALGMRAVHKRVLLKAIADNGGKAPAAATAAAAAVPPPTAPSSATLPTPYAASLSSSGSGGLDASAEAAVLPLPLPQRVVSAFSLPFGASIPTPSVFVSPTRFSDGSSASASFPGYTPMPLPPQVSDALYERTAHALSGETHLPPPSGPYGMVVAGARTASEATTSSSYASIGMHDSADGGSVGPLDSASSRARGDSWLTAASPADASASAGAPMLRSVSDKSTDTPPALSSRTPGVDTLASADVVARIPDAVHVDPSVLDAYPDLRKYVMVPSEVRFDPAAVVGTGCYGTVYCSTWRASRVAVKALRLQAYSQLVAAQLEALQAGGFDAATGRLTREAATGAGGVQVMLPAGTDLSTAARLCAVHCFLQEVDVIHRVSNHDNIVTFRGILLSPLAMVTEFMARGSVEDLLVKSNSGRYIRGHAAITLPVIVSMAAQAAAGLTHIHAQGVFHRDIAARNLLVNDSFQVKVADFGYSRVLQTSARVHVTATDVGPVAWMAPEALMDRSTDARSDVFSFGVTLYEMLTGKSPWAGVSTHAVPIMVAEGKRLPLPDELDADLAALVRACWRGNPEERPTMQQVYDTLVHWLRAHGVRDPHVTFSA